jgi:hypothetical protein
MTMKMENEPFGIDVAGLGEKTSNWQFINICEPSQVQDGEFRRQVKKNAMQGYRRRERTRCVRDYQKKKITMNEGVVPKSTEPSTEEGQPPPEIPFSVVKFKLQSKSDKKTLTLTRRDRYRTLDPAFAPSFSNAHPASRATMRNATYLGRTRRGHCAEHEDANQSLTDLDLVGSPKSLLGAGRVDPFGATPVNKQLSHYLTDHCKRRRFRRNFLNSISFSYHF